MITKVNNYSFVNTANVLDSVTPTPHIVCNKYLSGNVVRHSRPQTNLNSPESRPLDPPRVLELGGCFF
uniref:ORF9 n=1 Tax=Nitrosopumilaceae spindle-shaped virus TaxID=3065433 RepID=A0AAT9JA55_9VIRU